MRKLSDVTEEEMKKEYDKTPAMNQYVPWAEVLANSTYSTILKNQVISHEEKTMEQKPDQNRIFLAIDNGKELPVFTCMDLGAGRIEKLIDPAPAPAAKKITHRSTITLHEKQIDKIRNAVILGRNCLRSVHVNDLLRSEALSDLAEAQKILQSFYEPRA